MADEHHELVIIKRHGGDHDDHHGGAWKIAFADFMTAMMAFFLVMWLLAANDKTRASIARYFNPVKLVDATIRPPGLVDPKENDLTVATAAHDTDMSSKGESKDVGHKEPPGPPPHETPSGRQARLDATLRTNPFVALAEIAGSQGASDAPPKDTPRANTPVIGRKGGAAFRDPFAPPPPQAPESDEKDSDVLAITPPRQPPPAPPAPPSPDADVAALTKPASTEGPMSQKAAAAAPMSIDPARQSADKDLTSKLMASLRMPDNAGGGPKVDVHRTSEGFLVSLTDTDNFSMFTSGSAVPSKRVIQLMERVAKVLADKPGGVVIRGFTDNKPFRSGHYDNWNLSVDRAQAAHYMLVRGGLADTRIAGIQGFADRKPGAGLDAGSPLNRRIEILLKDDAK